jgi:glycine/D-amino acid oxidase-like deaminating enzyme
VINAAGPFFEQVGRMLGVKLPVRCELHQKASIMDTRGVVWRDAPLLICADPQHLNWSDEERQVLAEDETSSFLLGELPSGAHTRPDGGPDSPVLLLLWEVRQEALQPSFPLPLDPFYPEIALRGLRSIVPGLGRYLEKPSRPNVDGGYYVKTPENHPLIGPLPVKGAYAYGALSGYGIMAACAAGELIARHITGGDMPSYSPAFLPQRYQDPAYQQKLENWGEDYQL